MDYNPNREGGGGLFACNKNDRKTSQNHSNFTQGEGEGGGVTILVLRGMPVVLRIRLTSSTIYRFIAFLCVPGNLSVILIGIHLFSVFCLLILLDLPNSHPSVLQKN